MNSKFKKIILICGMPRSGTSWLGQIFDSSPNVAFRMEPLFAYKFKNIINEESTKEEIINFLNNVYLSDDDFICQKMNRQKKSYPLFEKNNNPDILVIKTTRHHNLLSNYLNLIDEIEIVSIIRHPCASINSWVNTDREFNSKGCSIEKDWRDGGCRKGDVGEYWGFNDWKQITKEHVYLASNHNNFHILQYSDLINRIEYEASNLFSKLSINFTKQTKDFLISCQNNHNEDPYSVFKNSSVESAWKNLLDPVIAQTIISETISAGLGIYCR